MTEPVLTALSALLGAGLTTYFATPAVARAARAVGALDLPGGRKVHVAAVPRLGGVALFAGFLAGTLVYGAAFGWDRLAKVFTGEPFLVLLLPAGFVFLVGVVDDVRGLGPAPRVVAELLAAGVLVQAGYVIDVVANPFGEPLSLGLLAVPVTLLWFVGVTNAFNLVDGMDGLMSLLGVAALGGIAAVGYIQGQTGTATLALALCGGLLGFLRWNWHPARIFLGDSGSLLVGFVVAALSLKVARTPDMRTLNAHVPLALAAIPITETFLTIARRYVSGKAYFSGDQSHIHHVLLKSGLPVPAAVGILGLLAALFSAVAALSLFWRGPGEAATIAILLVAIGFGLRRLHYVEIRVLLDRLRHGLFKPRRRGLSELADLVRAGDALRAARTPADLRAALEGACAAARFRFLAVEPPAPGPLPGPPASPSDAPGSEARAWLASRGGTSPVWIFTAPAAEEPGPDAAATCTVELRLDGTGPGRIAWCRRVDPAHPGPTIRDIQIHLGEPLSEALKSVPPAPAAGYDGRLSPVRGPESRSRVET